MSSTVMQATDRGELLLRELERCRAMGIGLITAADPAFPEQLKNRLRSKCPTVLYTAGDTELLGYRAIAFVGSRTAGREEDAFIRRMAGKTVRAGFAVVSGGARGCDTFAEQAAVEAGGYVVEYLADSILRRLDRSRIRRAVEEGRLLLLSAEGPDAAFHAWSALARNRYIYAHAEAAIIAKADPHRGGTWSGAMEAMKTALCPVLCRDLPFYTGNQGLIRNGAAPIGDDWDGDIGELIETASESSAKQMSLFE